MALALGAPASAQQKLWSWFGPLTVMLIALAAFIATDRVGMMYRGRLIFDGTTEEAKASTEPRVRQFVHGLTEGPL